MANYKHGSTYKKRLEDSYDKERADHAARTMKNGHITTSARKASATVVQHTGGATKYRFPMPDKAHARAALQDLPKAKGLSSAEKAKIKSRAERMLGKSA